MEETIISNTASSTGSRLQRGSAMISASVFPVLLRKFVGTHRTEVRSLLKAVSWRFFGSLVTVFIAFLLTRKLGLSLSIGAFEFVGKIALYYLHDRIWDRIF